MRLAAQRQLYATAKAIFGAQLIISGPFAVASAFWGLSCPEARGYIALWGLLVVLGDLFWLTPLQKRLRETAAKVQEAFDCDVLSLPWNELKAGKRPDPELVKEQSERYERWADKMPTLKNWYSAEVDDLPLHVGRIACQRSNCWWDSKQRRRYAATVIGAVVLIFVVVLWLALGQGFTLEDFLLKVVFPLAPALLLGIRQFTEQMEAATRLDKLKEHAERLWNEALGGKSEKAMTNAARGLQDEIFESRKRSPLVFDIVFKRLRSGYEVQMNQGVAELAAEAKQRLRVM